MSDRQPYRGQRGNFARFRGRGRFFRPYNRRTSASTAALDTQPLDSSNKSTSTQKKITDYNLAACPYPGWKMYFPDEGKLFKNY